jgi:predicted DNA-binding WGR domain protein
MRRFELVEGSSSKFWEVDRVDAAVTVRYGRIGTAGTAQTKTHADAATAARDAERLVREKLAKGYVEQGVASAPAVVAPPVAATTKTATPAPRATDVWAPPGVLRWTATWRKLLPDFARPAATPVWFAADRVALLADEPLTGAKSMTFYGQPRVPPLPVLDGAALRALLTPAALAGGVALYWVVRLCALWADAPTAIGAYLRQFCGPPGREHIPDYWVSRELGLGLDDVRALIEGLDAAARERIDAQLAAFATTGVVPAIVAAALSPRSAERIDVALSAFATNTNTSAWPLLLRCDLSAAQVDALLAQPLHQHGLDRDDATRLALLAARLPTERAVAAFDTLIGVVSSADARNALAKAARAHDSAAAMQVLVKHVSMKEMRAQLDEFAQAWPALALASAAELGDALDKPARQWLAGFANAYPDAIALAREHAGDAARAVLDALKPRAALNEAALDAVPAVLRDPPWLRPRVVRAAPAIALDAVDLAPELVWPPGLEARWRARSPDDPTTLLPWVLQHAGKRTPGEWLLGRFKLAPDWIGKLAAGERPPFDDAGGDALPFVLLLTLPLAAGSALWAWSNPATWYDYEDTAEAVAARWGLAFLPGLVNYVNKEPEAGLKLALPFRATALAPAAASALRTSRKARGAAQAWLVAHAAIAAAALLPAALRDDAAGLDAQYALRWLARNGRAAELGDGAAHHGEAGRAALDHVLAFDARSLFPDKLPKLPAFWTPRAYARPELVAGGALPESCLDALGTMLAFSRPDAPYAGIDDVASACTPASLAAFAWNLFESWLAAGAPGKEQWAFTALARIGGDEAARRLAPLVRAWPGEGGHARAVAGLDVLAGIGSDVALMHLHGIAQKVKFKALQREASARIDLIAQTRGLNVEQLADRLVPDLGLDADGGLALDFGPRAFRVDFDEELKPFVRDANGARLKDLPKPNRDDDAALAGDATERYKALKKDVRALAALQIRRLESAMVERRRWSVEEFRLFFVEHPLLRHLVRRLLWGAYRDGATVVAFRVAEDASFADMHDAAFALPDDAHVGIVHPLELDAATLAAFGQVYADYEIAQPFAQLGRETYALADDERAQTALQRFEGRRIATGSVLGLEHRGWRRGAPQDAGWIGWMTRELPDDVEAELGLDPGMSAGDISLEPVQRLTTLVLRRRGTWNDEGNVAFARLDDIVVSELLRDIDLIPQLP